MNRDMNVTTIIMRLRIYKCGHVYYAYARGKSHGRDKIFVQNFGKKKHERKKVCAKYRRSGSSRVKYTLKIGNQAGALIHLAPYMTPLSGSYEYSIELLIPGEGREFFDTSKK